MRRLKGSRCFCEMVNYLFTSTKTDEIYKEFNHICQVIRPSEFDYFRNEYNGGIFIQSK